MANKAMVLARSGRVGRLQAGKMEELGYHCRQDHQQQQQQKQKSRTTIIIIEKAKAGRPTSRLLPTRSLAVEHSHKSLTSIDIP